MPTQAIFWKGTRPSVVTGDLPYAEATGSPDRWITLPIGAAGTVLASNGTIPGYVDKSTLSTQFTTTSTGNIDDLDFSNADLIRMNNASLATIRGLKAGTAGQRVTIVSIGAGQVDLSHQNTGDATPGSRLINLATSAASSLVGGFATYQYDGTTARWRMVEHQQGDVIFPGFSAGNYTGNGAMTWTVDSGDVVIEWYNMSGNLLTVNMLYNNTSVGGTPNTLLQRVIPGGFTVGTNRDGRMPYEWLQSGTPGTAIVTIGGSMIFFQVDSVPSNWTSTTNATTITATAIARVT